MISEELVLITSRFDAALERITKEVEQKSQRMRRSFEGAGGRAGAGGGAGGGILGAIGGGVGGFGKELLGLAGFGSAIATLTTVGATVKDSLGRADDIADLTLKLNESADALQRVDFAGKLAAGQGVEQVANAMVKLERALGDPENEKAAQALRNLGLTAEQLAAVPLDQKMILFAEAFQKARASGTGLNDIQALLGRSASELIPLFEQGGDALREMFAEAPVMGEMATQQLAKINDELDALILKGKGLLGEAIGDVAITGGFFSDVFNALREGASLREAGERATANLFNEEIRVNREVKEREAKRQETAAAQQAAAQRVAAEAAEKAKQEEQAKEREDWKKSFEKTRQEELRLQEQYRDARFDTMTPEQQLATLLKRMSGAMGVTTTDEAEILKKADELASSGATQEAMIMLQTLQEIRTLTARMGGLGGMGAMERTQPMHQGSFADLMDQIFERDQRALTNIATNTGNAKTVLDRILENMETPPDEDRFDDL
jgi:hypothetical protein